MKKMERLPDPIIGLNADVAAKHGIIGQPRLTPIEELVRERNKAVAFGCLMRGAAKRRRAKQQEKK
jgi:hypothetical protein